MSSAIAKIIKNRGIVDDDWIVLRPEKDVLPMNVVIPSGKIIVPLKVWLKQKETLLCRTEIGVWLSGNEQPEPLKSHLEHIKVVAVDFSKFTDGRGYSIAHNLRAHIGYKGELRAIGDIQRDQLFYLQRVGFDAFAPHPNRDLEDVLKGLNDFSVKYQASWDETTPLFRRVDRGGEKL